MTQHQRDFLTVHTDDVTRRMESRRVPRPIARLLPAFAGFGAALLMGFAAIATVGGGRAVVAAEPSNATPAIVELFTSQGCYSCPPAEALLGELIESGNSEHLVALEFHVDYWDKLVYGSHGSHKDPFSSPANTLRQRQYNQVGLSGRQGVYTPQLVVNGRHGAIGSRRGDVLDGINRVERSAVELRVAATGESVLSVSLEGDVAGVPADAQVWLAVFDVEETTVIETGENHDKTLTSHHIVRSFETVSLASETEIEVAVSLGEGQGCALLVQSPDLGPIHGAAYCPDSLWRSAKG